MSLIDQTFLKKSWHWVSSGSLGCEVCIFHHVAHFMSQNSGCHLLPCHTRFIQKNSWILWTSTRLTKNFMETEWGKTEVRLALRSWRSQAIRRPTVILVPDRKLIRRIDADLDLHQLLSKGVVINCSGLLFRRRLVMALPQVRRSRPVASQQFVVVSVLQLTQYPRVSP